MPGIELVVTQITDILEQKENILKQMKESLKAQREHIQGDTIYEEQFEQLQKVIDNYIARLSILNEQFEQTIAGKEHEFEAYCRANSEEVKVLKDANERTQKLSQEVEAEEKQIKKEFQEYIGYERRAMQEKQMQRASAAKYYKTMTKQMDMMSALYDQSK